MSSAQRPSSPAPQFNYHESQRGGASSACRCWARGRPLLSSSIKHNRLHQKPDHRPQHTSDYRAEGTGNQRHRLAARERVEDQDAASSRSRPQREPQAYASDSSTEHGSGQHDRPTIFVALLRMHSGHQIGSPDIPTSLMHCNRLAPNYCRTESFRPTPQWRVQSRMFRRDARHQPPARAIKAACR